MHKNDDAWALLFDKYQILARIQAEGTVSIRAAEINEFREARLMTKFDHSSQLPEIFKDHQLSILPTSRGTYEIGTFETFHNFSSQSWNIPIQHTDLPQNLQSVDSNDISSEAVSLNCAFDAKILEKFSEEDSLYPTVSGRMGSSDFNFYVNTKLGPKQIFVRNSQIEIDGGYEGDSSLILLEAKLYIADDFMVRQLYYPYRLWSNKVSKRIRPIFLTYTNGVYDLREYEFIDPDNYNSIRQIRHQKFSFQNFSIPLKTIWDYLGKKEEPEPSGIPFPQANNFARVINLCELLLHRGFLSNEEITRSYSFVARQANYYGAAAEYLGLAVKAVKDGENGYKLTEKGRRVMRMPLKERQREFVRLLLNHSVFKAALEDSLDKGGLLTKAEIVDIMRKKQVEIGDSTLERRASTVVKWLEWIFERIDRN